VEVIEAATTGRQLIQGQTRTRGSAVKIGNVVAHDGLSGRADP
jgi:hypothetical protein